MRWRPSDPLFHAKVALLFDASLLLVEALAGACVAGRGHKSIPPEYATMLKNLQRSALGMIPRFHRRIKNWDNLIHGLNMPGEGASVAGIRESVSRMRSAATILDDARADCEGLEETWGGLLRSTNRPGILLLRRNPTVSPHAYATIQASWEREGETAWNIAAYGMAGIAACLLQAVEGGGGVLQPGTLRRPARL